MIKLGKLTDYAVAVAVQLSREGDTPRSASHIAEKTGLPEPTVAKVLKKLSQEKVVDSARGAAGGYRLSQAASAVTIRHIIEAMDGPIAITTCVDESETSCTSGVSCPARGKWGPVNEAIKAALSAVTIADMAAQSACAIAPLIAKRGMAAEISSTAEVA